MTNYYDTWECQLYYFVANMYRHLPHILYMNNRCIQIGSCVCNLYNATGYRSASICPLPPPQIPQVWNNYSKRSSSCCVGFVPTKAASYQQLDTSKNGWLKWKRSPFWIVVCEWCNHLNATVCSMAPRHCTMLVVIRTSTCSSRWRLGSWIHTQTHNKIHI